MTKLFVRGLVMLISAFFLFIAMNAWFSPLGLAEKFQLAVKGPVGGAAMRADVGGIFLAVAIFAFVAAWQQSRAWAFGVIVLVGSALTGRFVGLVMDGAGTGTIEPMLIEVIVIAVMLWAYTAWRRPPSGLL